MPPRPHSTTQVLGWRFCWFSTGQRCGGFRRPWLSGLRAFTLIEIMIVVSIMGIVMLMSVPMVTKLWHKAPMIKAIRDVREVLANARARAILQGTMTEVDFHPQAGRMEVGGGQAAAPRRARTEEMPSFEPSVPVAPTRSGLSAQLDETISLEMLDVNLTEYKDAEFARARFYPSGTCDELTIVLRSAKNEWYKISTEITTGLATVGPVDR